MLGSQRLIGLPDRVVPVDCSVAISDQQSILLMRKMVSLLEQGRGHRSGTFSEQTEPILQHYEEAFPFVESLMLATSLFAEEEMVRTAEVELWGYRDNAERRKTVDRQEQWHTHAGSNLSAIMYLKVPDLDTNPECGTEFADGIGYLEVKPKHWYLFDSALLHRPGVLTSNSWRYIVAGTLTFR